MKKLILLFVLVLGSTAIFAQDIKFGVKGGLNIANFKGDDADGTDSKVGINIGAFARIGLTKKLALQPELIYSQEGCKDNSDNKWKLNYLNIPLLLRAKMFGTDNFNLMAGPQIGFLVKSEIDNGDISVDADDLLKSTNFSLAFGLAYDINDKFSVDARYNLGLTKIMKDSDTFGDLSDAKINTSTFQLGLSYSF
jgi:opacity protein-like surface antigen